MTILFDNYSGGDTVTPTENAYKHSGGSLRVGVQATDFDGGIISFQGSIDNGITWITLDDVAGDPAAYSKNKITELLKLGIGDLTRAVLSGSGGSTTGLTVKLDIG